MISTISSPFSWTLPPQPTLDGRHATSSTPASEGAFPTNGAHGLEVDSTAGLDLWLRGRPFIQTGKSTATTPGAFGLRLGIDGDMKFESLVKKNIEDEILGELNFFGIEGG